MPTFHGFVLATAIFASAACVHIHASDAPPDTHPIDQAQRELRAFHPMLVGVAFIALDVPDPISPRDVDRYASTLRLDEHQTEIIHVFYERYAEKDNALRWKELAPLFEASAHLAAKRDMHSNPSSAAEFAAIMKERETVVKHLTASDDSLFSEIELLLSDEQLPRLEAVRRQRARARFRAVACDYVGGRIEVTQLLHDLNLSDETLADNPGALSLLDDYERSLTRLLENHCKLKVKWMVEETSLSAAAVSSKSLDMHHQDRERSLEVNGTIARAARRILDLNVKTIEAIASMLAPEVHRRLLDEFRRHAYPAVYPDPYVFEPIIEQSLEISGLSDEHRAAIAQIGEAHLAVEAEISKKMVDRYLARMDYFLVDKGVRMDMHEEYKKDMTDLQLQRRLNAEGAVREVKALLTEVQAQGIQKAEQSFLKALASHQPRESGLDFRP